MTNYIFKKGVLKIKANYCNPLLWGIIAIVTFIIIILDWIFWSGIFSIIGIFYLMYIAVSRTKVTWVNNKGEKKYPLWHS